jgi:hypothetical protein
VNLFKRFLGLRPDPPLQVGTVLAVVGGTATVELPGGGQVQARGAAAIGARVFVRDGVIEGGAPALPVELIEV